MCRNSWFKQLSHQRHIREPPSKYPCGAPRCKTCPILVTLDEFTSHTTGKSFKDDASSNVIYLITCWRCGQHLIRETGQSFNLRVNRHQLDITDRRIAESPVTAHFNSHPHSLEDKSVTVIKHARSQDPCMHRIRESRWIRTLGTLLLLGMNLRDDSL